eukprot:15341233-Ditylum_brightwellii.AAC.1
MDRPCLPRKFLALWHRNPRPVGRRQITIHHSYIHALHMIGAIQEDNKIGKLSDWFLQVTDDPKAWERWCKLLIPNVLGQKDQAKILESFKKAKYTAKYSKAAGPSLASHAHSTKEQYTEGDPNKITCGAVRSVAGAPCSDFVGEGRGRGAPLLGQNATCFIFIPRL